MRYANRVSMSNTPRRPPPANTTSAGATTAAQPKRGAKCPVCQAKFRQCKNARPECAERSAKSNLERHCATKGDEPHRAVAEALKAEDEHRDNWQQGRIPPGETRNASNWQGHTDQEWRTYIGHYNRHMDMRPADQQKGIEQPTFGRGP